VIGKIIDAAKLSGAQAIHPGYGFLSENAEFAEACAAAGLVFIGPPVEAIRAMGSKSAAKALMEKSGVPLVPGYHGADQSLGVLTAEAAKIGYPILLKPSAGGGGKGMRVVERAADLEAAIAAAKREAASSFGDDLLLIEKYLTNPRHIEVQIFGDMHGSIVSLFERDCSIQRRHQKIVEEAPAPGLSPGRRQEMSEAAIAAARAVAYVGAGTVEFIAEGDRFYFMEMNTRLQVEHPVTEAITGHDLVEWQLRVAAGEKFTVPQERITMSGHAIEVRIYAEDPARDFLPSTGKLVHLKAPSENANIRVDTGVRQGDAISIHYDPMIAKLIVRGRDRDEAARILSRALGDYEIAGVETNIGFLRTLIDHPAFREGRLDTGFIDRHAAELKPRAEPASLLVLAAAALRVLLDRRDGAAQAAVQSGDPTSPWHALNSWRIEGTGFQTLIFGDGEARITLRARPRIDGSFGLDLPDGTAAIAGEIDGDGKLALRLDGVRHRLSVIRSGDIIIGAHRLRLIDPLRPRINEAAADGRLTAPMPGKITQLLVAAGAEVKKGAPLLILEAMKMEHTIAAPVDGIVESVRCAIGDLVEEGAELIAFVAEKNHAPAV